jgi:hypothetical protein
VLGFLRQDAANGISVQFGYTFEDM